MSFRTKFILIGLVLLLIIGLSGVFYFYFGLISPNSPSAEKIDFEIKSGQGINEISSDLHEAGLIKDKFIFETYLWARDWEGKIKAGEYRLSKNLSIKDLVNVLKIGLVKNDIDIKIVEGWTIDDIADYLSKNNVAGKDEFLNLANNGAKFISDNLDSYPFLFELLVRNNNYSEISLEGYLFPDTYTIYVDAAPEDIIKKMLDNFDVKLDDEMRVEIEKQGKTIDEVVVLASIVEKEAAKYEDRRMAADVFLKRLKAGMPLQSDATINYITKKGTTRPSYEDLKVDSLYNTYTNKGLPPAPINSPSLSSIQAVIYPISNDYYYFLTDKEGNIYYGRNMEEHQVNRGKYLE
ncbi:MAG: endolytic transglycosylase MltG [bacterium]